MQADGSAGESEVYSSFNTAQMVEWHEMGCFISNPLIRRVEEKPKEEKVCIDDVIRCRLALQLMTLMLVLMKMRMNHKLNHNQIHGFLRKK